jgi:hypothetical protein
MNRRQSPAEMQAACDAFNAKHAVGDTITVFTGPIGENPREAQVRYPAEIMGGHTAVVYTSIGGCVALTHVQGAA